MVAAFYFVVTYFWIKSHAPVRPQKFLSVKWNAAFLKNTLHTLVIFSVFQEFYNLRKYIRVKKDSITGLSCFTYVGGIYKMSCLVLIVWGADFAPSFNTRHVIATL